MGLLSFLNPWRNTGPPDYETILSRLSTEITDAKTNLSEIRLRERRYMLLLNVYGALLWIVWTAVWWLGGVPWGLVGMHREDMMAQVVGTGLTLLSPLGLIGFNRVLRYFYTVQRGKEENHLRVLLNKQHTYIEDIKKSNNFYKTKDLIDRYDEEAPLSTPTPSQRPIPRGQAQDSPSPASRVQTGGRMATTPISASPAALGGVPGSGPSGSPATPSSASIEASLSPQQIQQLRMLQQSQLQPVLPTPQKKWYDHMADKLMGEDPSQAAHTKYALVCGGCFRHNGLVGGGKEEWERTQWICPRCNYFNPAPKSRSSASTEPASITTLPDTPAAASTSALSTPSKPRQRGSVAPSSRLGKQVISAADVDGEDDRMDVDEVER